jgi:hypothetical protein
LNLKECIPSSVVEPRSNRYDLTLAELPKPSASCMLRPTPEIRRNRSHPEISSRHLHLSIISQKYDDMHFGHFSSNPLLTVERKLLVNYP